MTTAAIRPIFGAPGGNPAIQFCAVRSHFLDSVHEATTRKGLLTPLFLRVPDAVGFLPEDTPDLPVDGGVQALNALNHSLNVRKDAQIEAQSVVKDKLLTEFRACLSTDRLEYLKASFENEDAYRLSSIVEKFHRFEALYGIASPSEINALLLAIQNVGFQRIDNGSLQIMITNYRRAIQYLATKGVIIDQAQQILNISSAVQLSSYATNFRVAIHDFDVQFPSMTPERTVNALITFLERANATMTSGDLQSAFAIQAAPTFAAKVRTADPQRLLQDYSKQELLSALKAFKSDAPTILKPTCTHPPHAADPTRYPHTSDKCYVLHPELDKRPKR